MASGITSRALLIVLLCGVFISLAPAYDHDVNNVVTGFADVCDISGSSVSTKIESLAGPAVFLAIKNGTEILFWTVWDAKLLVGLVRKGLEDQTRLEHVSIIREFLSQRHHVSVDASAQSAMIELFKKFCFKPRNLSEMGPRWSIAFPRFWQCVEDVHEELMTTFVDLSVIDLQTGDVLINPACMPAQRNQILHDRCEGKSPFAFLYVLPDVGVTKKNPSKEIELPQKSPDFSETRFFTAKKICGALAAVCALGWTLLTGDAKDQDPKEPDPDDEVLPELKNPLRLISQRRCSTPPARCHQTKNFDGVCQPRAASVSIDAHEKRGEVPPRGSFKLYKKDTALAAAMTPLPVAASSPAYLVHDVVTSPILFDELVEDVRGRALQEPERFSGEGVGASSEHHGVHEVEAMAVDAGCFGATSPVLCEYRRGRVGCVAPDSCGYRQGHGVVCEHCQQCPVYAARYTPSYFPDDMRRYACAEDKPERLSLREKVLRFLRPKKYVPPKLGKKVGRYKQYSGGSSFLFTLRDTQVYEIACPCASKNIAARGTTYSPREISICLSRAKETHLAIHISGGLHVFTDSGKTFFFTLKQVTSSFRLASLKEQYDFRTALQLGCCSIKKILKMIDVDPVEVTFCFRCWSLAQSIFLRLCEERTRDNAWRHNYF